MNMIWLAILAILITALAGALWRRLLGRWDWPMLWVLPPLYAVIGGGLCLLFWALDAEALEAGLEAQIEAKKNPITATGLPW